PPRHPPPHPQEVRHDPLPAPSQHHPDRRRRRGRSHLGGVQQFALGRHLLEDVGGRHPPRSHFPRNRLHRSRPDVDRGLVRRLLACCHLRGPHRQRRRDRHRG